MLITFKDAGLDVGDFWDWVSELIQGHDGSIQIVE
jgi:hypothetical protein